SGPLGSTPPAVSNKVPHAPATEAEARRVTEASQKLLEANPHLTPRPVFITLGVDHEEVFYVGTSLVYITEGLSRRCASEAQLAAVLAMELGRMVAERERLASPDARQAASRQPPRAPVGTDYREGFGGPDRTRQMELYKYDQERRQAPPPPMPSAAAVARGLLEKAGYAPGDLDAVAPLLRQAEAHVTLERQITGKAT